MLPSGWTHRTLEHSDRSCIEALIQLPHEVALDRVRFEWESERRCWCRHLACHMSVRVREWSAIVVREREKNRATTRAELERSFASFLAATHTTLSHTLIGHRARSLSTRRLTLLLNQSLASKARTHVHTLAEGVSHNARTYVEALDGRLHDRAVVLVEPLCCCRCLSSSCIVPSCVARLLAPSARWHTL